MFGIHVVSAHVQYNVCDTHIHVSVAVSITSKPVFIQLLCASSIVTGAIVSSIHAL